jgi:hypothetical protein
MSTEVKQTAFPPLFHVSATPANDPVELGLAPLDMLVAADYLKKKFAELFFSKKTLEFLLI